MKKQNSSFRKFIIFLDLDTVPKVTSFVAELVPFVGLGYAIIGYNLAGQKLKIVDRGLYLAGEFMASGHLLRAFKGNIAKQGFSKTSQIFLKQSGKKAGQIVAKRAVNSAQQQVLRTVTK